MKNYRLKPDAVKYFKEGLATSIHSWDTWTQTYHVDENALEEVQDAYLTYGHSNHKNQSKTLAGWDGDNGSHFHFTIIFPSVKFAEHDKFSNGKVVRQLMNNIQRCVDNFYMDFANKEDEL